MTRKKRGVPSVKGSVWIMQKKVFSWAMCMAVAAMLACTGCAQTGGGTSDTIESTVTQTTTDGDDSNEEKSTVVGGQTLSAIQSGVIGVTTDEDDLCSEYDNFDAEITLKDDNTSVTGDSGAVSVSGNQITISAGGTYRLTGTLTSGQVLVTGAEKVKLYLDGVTIASPSGPAIVCVNEKRTILSLADGTENMLADSDTNEVYTLEAHEIDPCALYAQDKLTMNGSGSLTVKGNSKDGIICKDDLKLVSGNITVDAVQNGVKGKDCVAMFGADLTVTAGNDGVKSTETEDTTKGFLQLEKGSATIHAGGDCFQAETLVWVTDGSYTLTSTGTAVNAETGEMSSAKGVHCSGDVEISGGTMTIDAQADGIHCNGSLELKNGSLDVTSAEDGIQADGDLTVSGGTVQVVTTGVVASSGQDDFGGFGGEMQPGGFGGEMPFGDAPELPDGNMPSDGRRPMGGEVEQTNLESAASVSVLATTEENNVETTAEETTSKGIKCGGNLIMSGGSCTITATDHAVHAIGTATFSGASLDITSDHKGISVHGDLMISGGSVTIQRCTEGIESKANMTISGGEVRVLDASDDGLNTGGSEGASHAMTISGGYVYICAAGDGVDSNSSWEMSGGTLIVCGPVSGGDGSLDANGTMTYSGGTLLALSNRGMLEYPESGCLVATNCSASAGDAVSIVDQNGTVLATIITPKEVSDVIYGIGDASAEEFTIVVGGTYDGTRNADGYGEGGTISGGTEIAANGGSGYGNRNGGQFDMPGGQRDGDFPKEGATRDFSTT